MEKNTAELVNKVNRIYRQQLPTLATKALDDAQTQLDCANTLLTGLCDAAFDPDTTEHVAHTILAVLDNARFAVRRAQTYAPDSEVDVTERLATVDGLVRMRSADVLDWLHRFVDMTV